MASRFRPTAAISSTASSRRWRARTPDPDRILRAYYQAAQTLNLVRGFADGGFAALTSVHKWNREFVASSPEGRRYEAVANGIDATLTFMRACRIQSDEMDRTHIYASHEALLLPYEQAMTRQDSMSENADDSWYDCSAHMLWVGTRTKLPDSAHVEFLRGVRNPIGVKIDASTTIDHLILLCTLLNPERQPGRLTLISRMGKDKIQTLGPMIDAISEAEHPVVWMCDPMHGNTFDSDGLKTRSFDDVFEELTRYFEVHRQRGTWPGGIHLELTGANVTECLGGSDRVTDDDLRHRYETACDPRLNARQSLDLAFPRRRTSAGFPGCRSEQSGVCRGTPCEVARGSGSAQFGPLKVGLVPTRLGALIDHGFARPPRSTVRP